MAAGGDVGRGGCVTAGVLVGSSVAVATGTVGSGVGDSLGSEEVGVAVSIATAGLSAVAVAEEVSEG